MLGYTLQLVQYFDVSSLQNYKLKLLLGSLWNKKCETIQTLFSIFLVFSRTLDVLTFEYSNF